jgi:hypothetical protein
MAGTAFALWQGLTLLAVFSSRSTIKNQEQNDGPGVPLWFLGVSRVAVILLGLLGFFEPSTPSGRITTGESRRI